MGRRVDLRVLAVVKAWERSNGRRWRAAVTTSRRLAQLTAGVEAEIAAQPASTPDGEQARKLALATTRELRRAYSLTASAISNTARGRRAGLSQAKRADRAFARAVRYHRRTVRAFKALGLT